MKSSSRRLTLWAIKRADVVDSLGKKFGVKQKDVLSSEEFGPTVGQELKTNALKSVLIAAIGMLIYIIFRFKSWKYGVSSIAGIFHDVLIVLAFYAIFNVTINNPFIAGILTVVGYSINDTIVIFLIELGGKKKDLQERHQRGSHRPQCQPDIEQINHDITDDPDLYGTALLYGFNFH